MRIFVCCALLLSLFGSPADAMSPDAVGQIKNVNGEVSILRGKDSLPGTVGTALYRSDLIRTAKPGATGIVLLDGTTISLGPNSELAIKDYVFAPKEEKFSLAVRMAKGTFVYLSGLIGKLSPGAVKLTIPNATIGVRGTKLLIDVQE